MYKPDPRHLRALKPNVTREQALQLFTAGPLAFATGLVHGRARSISDLCIPYRFFQVKVKTRGKEEARIFALEAFRGVMDLYEFSEVPTEADLLTVNTRNFLPSTLQDVHAHDALIAKVRRLIFTRGFFRIRDLHIQAIPLATEVYIPYWICFRGTNSVYISILDAIRRKPEGAKARHLVEDWLRSSGDDANAVSL